MLPSPSNLRVAKHKNGVPFLEWDAVEGANTYRLYYKKSPDEFWADHIKFYASVPCRHTRIDLPYPPFKVYEVYQYFLFAVNDEGDSLASVIMVEFVPVTRTPDFFPED